MPYTMVETTWGTLKYFFEDFCWVYNFFLLHNIIFKLFLTQNLITSVVYFDQHLECTAGQNIQQISALKKVLQW